MSRSFIPMEESFGEWRKDSEYVAAYDALEDEFAVVSALIKARGNADMTQEESRQRDGNDIPLSRAATGRQAGNSCEIRNIKLLFLKNKISATVFRCCFSDHDTSPRPGALFEPPWRREYLENPAGARCIAGRVAFTEHCWTVPPRSAKPADLRSALAPQVREAKKFDADKNRRS